MSVMKYTSLAANLPGDGSQQARDGGQRRRQVGVAVRRPQVAELLANAAGVLRRLRHDAPRRGGHEDDAVAVGRWPLPRRSCRPVLRARSKQVVSPVLSVHAERAVDDDDPCEFVPLRRGRPCRPAGLAQRQAASAHGVTLAIASTSSRTTRQRTAQQEELLEAHSSSVLPLRGEQEAHGRPLDDLEPPAVEQVDDDRDAEPRPRDGGGGSRALEEDGEERG